MLIKQINTNKKNNKDSLTSPRVSLNNQHKRPATSRSMIDNSHQSSVRIERENDIQFMQQGVSLKQDAKNNFKGMRTIYSQSFRDPSHTNGSNDICD